MIGVVDRVIVSSENKSFAFNKKYRQLKHKG